MYRVPEAGFMDSPQVLDSGWCFSSMLGLAASEWSIANGATVRGTGAQHTVRSTRRNDAMRLFMRSIHKNGPQVDTIVVGADTVCFANPWKGRPFSPQAGRGTSHSTLMQLFDLANQRLSTDQEGIPVLCSPGP